MYLIVAFAVTILVIVLAWRGVGATRDSDDAFNQRPRPVRPQRPTPPRVVAPGDDPEFLSEIDRCLSGEHQSC
jgi:hypothetical protein